MNLPRLISKNSSSSNGYSRPMLINCIHCDEEQTEKKPEEQQNDLQLDKLMGIENIDKKDYRLCSDCVDTILSDLQQQITNFSEEISILQEKKINITQLVEQSKLRFQPNDFKILKETELNLISKISQEEQSKKLIQEEVKKLQDEFCKTLKEENNLDDEILDLEKQILDLIEQKEMQTRELQQVNDQIKELESQSFLRDQFRIKFKPNMINGFQLTIPTKESYMEFNQGMGQLCLLFEYIKRQVEYQSKRIRQFECNGGVSKVERSQGLSLELYCKMSDGDGFNNKKISSARFHIPFEGIREFALELIDFFLFIYTKYQKEMDKNKLKLIQKEEFEKRIGELQQKQEIKECWDFFFSQILYHFDCILDVFQPFE